MDKIITWVKTNIIIAIGILVAVVLIFFPKLFKGLFGPRRVRHRRIYRVLPARRRRSLPRSVGMSRSRPRRQYTKGGKAKKAWQIKGSLAARRHMARIRKMR